MRQRLIGIEVEHCSAGGVPALTMKAEHGRGVAQIADGRQSFHVAAFDGLKLNRDANERGQPARVAFAGKLDARLPFDGLPAQTARLTAGCRSLKELEFQSLALLPKQAA